MSRKVLSIVLALAVLAVPAGALHARSLGVRPSPESFLDVLSRWLAGNAPGLAALWDKEGPDMDPDGLKEGSDMDPNGRTAPRPAPPAMVDAGSEMDPNG